MGRFKTHEERDRKKIRKLEERRAEYVRQVEVSKKLLKPDSPKLSDFIGAAVKSIIGKK